jgi:hypothetical protein
MTKASSILLLLLLAGCSGVPQRQSAASPCAAGESSYPCQVERYHNVNTP